MSLPRPVNDGGIDVVRLGRTLCEFGTNWCRTTLADGAEIVAMAEDAASYRATAAECGYGADTDRLCVEHELMHTLLACWLELPESYTLSRVAHGDVDVTALTRLEEAAVISIQAFASAMGVNLRSLVVHEALQG